MAHVAERAAPCAEVAQDHEGSGALAETFTDIGTGGFLAHRVQFVLAQHTLDIVVALAAARLDAYPFGLAQALLQLHDLDRIARGFACAGLFVFSVAHKCFRI